MATATLTRASVKRQTLKAFSLTKADQHSLASEIYTQRLNARRAARNHVAQTVGAPVDDAWEPPEATLRAMADASVTSAAQIAQTYHEELEAQIEHAMNADAEPLTRGVVDWVGRLIQWANGRAQSKSQQVGQWETGDAAEDGTDDFLGEMYGGAVTPGVDLNSVQIAIVPGDSSDDSCADYAGNTYTLDDMGDLPDFPAHLGCIHSRVITLA